MVFRRKNRIVQHQYTIIELLVVLVIAGLLTGLAVGGIKGALARQGATGAVRTLGAKISLAQSFAVSRNRYVALLMPDYDGLNGSPENIDSNDYNYKISDKTANSAWNKHYSYCFTYNRLCFVTKDTSVDPVVYKFDRWVEGYEWQKLPTKTVAFVTDEPATTNKTSSVAAQVEDVPDPTHSNPPSNLVDCTAIIFKPSGALINAESVVIRIFRAAYLPNEGTGSESVFYWQGNEDRDKGWKIVINGFTGRAKFCEGYGSVDDDK